jgi:hypothetical protein
MPARHCRGLLDLGHQVEMINDSYQDFGAGQFIWRLGDPSREATSRRAIRGVMGRRWASNDDDSPRHSTHLNRAGGVRWAG